MAETFAVPASTEASKVSVMLVAGAVMGVVMRVVMEPAMEAAMVAAVVAVGCALRDQQLCGQSL